jgi:hypothetical protein
VTAAPLPEERDRRRNVMVAVALGIAVALIMFVLVAALLTMPLFALARFTEGETALHRPWFGRGLKIAGVLGGATGLVAGVWLARFYRRGGRFELPEPTP